MCMEARVGGGGWVREPGEGRNVEVGLQAIDRSVSLLDEHAGSEVEISELTGDNMEISDQCDEKVEISDQTGDKERSIRRQIYLTIMSSLNHEECAHKLLKTMGKGNEVSLFLLNYPLACVFVLGPSLHLAPT